MQIFFLVIERLLEPIAASTDGGLSFFQLKWSKKDWILRVSAPVGFLVYVSCFAAGAKGEQYYGRPGVESDALNSSPKSH
jgi:hypothetical protein